MDEPSIDMAVYAEDMKNILAGQRMHINVKYLAAVMITVPPIIILSNKENLFYMNSEIWLSRIKCFRMKQFGVPDECRGANANVSIYPMAWLKLFEKYLNISI